MSHDIRQLVEEALKLPVEARAALADKLIESLDETIDEDVEAAWQREIAQRVRDLADGKQRPIPWSEVRERIERGLRGAR